MIDIHAHLCFPQFEGTVESVVEKCKEELSAVVVSSARYEESVKVLELCKRHSGFLFPTLGHHPTEGTDFEKTIELIKKNSNVVVGVGEVGLDYHWEKNEAKREEQKKVFREFIELAKKIKKPLVIHSWDAEKDCFELVKDSGIECVFHCFSGSPELAEEIVDSGFYVSVSTQICFSKRHKKIAKRIPLDKMLLETDSPFLSPQMRDSSLPSYAGFDPKINYPWNIKISAEKIAKIKGTDARDVLEHAKRNAIKVFGLNIGESK